MTNSPAFWIGYIVLIFAFMYFIAIRPQQKEKKKMQELKIGVLRIEDVNEETGKIILTVAEDADCSGLPVLGETVCNYDEGFIAGILSLYSGKPYTAVEVDCWATGDRVCRFHADVQE